MIRGSYNKVCKDIQINFITHPGSLLGSQHLLDDIYIYIYIILKKPRKAATLYGGSELSPPLSLCVCVIVGVLLYL